MSRLVARRSKAGGYILVFVLLLLLVITLLAASVLQSSYYDGYTMTSSRHQSEAAINAMTGAQAGVAQLRAQAIDTGVLSLCESAAACTAPSIVATLAEPNRYQVTVFKRPRMMSGSRTFNDGLRTPLVVVSSLGRAAHDSSITPNPNFTSLIEVEVQVPETNGPGSGGGSRNSKAGGD
jgi:Tfp pilus assembly protein PilX